MQSPSPSPRHHARAQHRLRKWSRIFHGRWLDDHPGGAYGASALSRPLWWHHTWDRFAFKVSLLSHAGACRHYAVPAPLCRAFHRCTASGSNAITTAEMASASCVSQSITVGWSRLPGRAAIRERRCVPSQATCHDAPCKRADYLDLHKPYQ